MTTQRRSWFEKVASWSKHSSAPVTHAARHDVSQLAALLDPHNAASGVWADTAFRSKTNRRLVDRRHLVAQNQRAKPRGRTMPQHNCTRHCDAGTGARPGRVRAIRWNLTDLCRTRRGSTKVFRAVIRGVRLIAP